MEDRSKLMEQEDKAVVKSSESSWIGREKVIADETDLHSSSSMSMNKVRQRMKKQQQHQHHGQLQDLEKAAWSVSPKIRKSSSKSNLKQRGRATAIDDIRPDDAADADDPGKAKEYYEDQDLELTACCGPRALWHRRTLAAGVDHLITIAEPDKEMQRIVRLSVPLTLGEMMECVFDSITVIIISQSMGTDDLTAYVTTDLMIGLTDEFIGGVIDAQHTLCSHAYGAGQNFLCGQYIQLGCVMYSIVSIPFLGGWVFAMKPVLLFLGLGDSVAQRAADYTRLVVIDYLLEGIAGSLDIILEITGHEVFGTVSDVLEGIVGSVGLIALVMTKKDATLVHVALLHLSVATLFLIVYFSIAYAKGWFRPFWKGMIKDNAFKNKPAVKNIFHTAVPLSIGSFLEYGEWELLTFTVAALGPAEVTVWALLGNVWEIFEASTVGLGDAAEIRTAYHLGKRNPELAKMSSYKSLFLSTIAGVFVTAILFMMGPNLATWFTKDPTLQHMLNDLIPIVGIGNITMTFGMTCWSIVGAQGRYRLATCISMASSWFVTIPLALLFTVGTKIDLQGVVSAVVVGYSTSGMILSYILITSDWKSISDTIYELNLAAGEMLSDDSDAGSSSSSGSSVSSESDSDDESSVDSDDDSDDDDNASKSIVSKRSVGSKSIVSKRSVGSKSIVSKRSVGSRSIVSKKSLSNTVSVS
jgi:Na+-driven multidrug efflux pump